MALLRLLKFILKHLYIILIVVALCIFVAFFAYDNAYINIVTRDGMSARCDCILNDYGAETETYKLQSLFTTNYVYNLFEDDSALFTDYSALNYRYSITVGLAMVWPWSTECTVSVSERVLDLSVKYIGDGTEDKDNVPEWPDGKYNVDLSKKNGVWKINKVTYTGPLEE